MRKFKYSFLPLYSCSPCFSSPLSYPKSLNCQDALSSLFAPNLVFLALLFKPLRIKSWNLDDVESFQSLTYFSHSTYIVVYALPIHSPYFSCLNDFQRSVDLKTLAKRVDSEQYYVTFEMFVADVKRMFANARTYNSPETIYYKCSTRHTDLIPYSHRSPFFSGFVILINRFCRLEAHFQSKVQSGVQDSNLVLKVSRN